MDKQILAIFDKEEKYAYGLMEFISNKAGQFNLPFQVHVFTNDQKFFLYSGQTKIEFLLVSENAYQKDIEKLQIPHIIILSESGDCLNETLRHINKYQACDAIYQDIFAYYSEYAQNINSVIRASQEKMKVIGVYTPIGRCLQTTFSLTLGQLLAREHKVLYLNFERYSGLARMLNRNFQNDISDLMYYFECAKEKLTYRLNSMVEVVNKLDFIPPVEIYQNLSGIRGKQWNELFQEIERCSEYEYLILDLTDGVMDLWDILFACSHIFTISRNDGFALAKMEQYERALENMKYEEILTKTKKIQLPIYKQLPVRTEELTYGELAKYINESVIPGLQQGNL